MTNREAAGHLRLLYKAMSSFKSYTDSKNYYKALLAVQKAIYVLDNTKDEGGNKNESDRSV